MSVLTPSFGYGRFIEDAIRSVEQQQGVSVEHHVQDAGSTDETVELLRGFSSVQWVSEPDEGQSDALNKALAATSGEWIAWLNADEFYLPHGLAALVDHAERVRADVAYGDCVFVDAEGKMIRLLPQHRFSGKVLKGFGCYIPSVAVVMRREFLGNSPWDKSLKRIMDWDLYLKLFASGARFTHLPFPIGAFRVHDERVTAAPPSDSSEEDEVASRYGLPSDAEERWKVSRPGRYLHPMQKALGGAYVRQFRARRLAGRDVRWFTGPAGRATWAELISTCYRRSRRHAVLGSRSAP